MRKDELSNKEIVKLEEIVKIYYLGRVPVLGIDGISLSVTRGDFVAIAGPSGSGKTTLLNIIGLIDRPSEGSVMIGGQTASRLNNSALTRLRHEKIGFIFQSFNLISSLTIAENIELPLVLGDHASPRRERKARVDDLIEETGLGDRRRHRPFELSGGQQQRVAIARALVTRPEIVIADEPTANLDSKTAETILNLMKKINREHNTTFIFSTHDPVIHSLADHVIVLKDGGVEKEYKQTNGGTS